jgi:hypothetical protein
MQRSTRWTTYAIAGAAGVLAALGAVTGLTQAQTPTTPTATATVPTVTAKTTTTKKATPKPTATTTTTTTTTKNITCRESLVATKAAADNSENFGTVTCSTPFGKGVRHDTATLAAPVKTAGAFSGGLKLFFNTGTLRGTYHLNFTILNKVVTYDGTVKISSGTGAFAGVTGSGTTAGTSDDGVHSTITEKLTLKIPPKKKTTS